MTGETKDGARSPQIDGETLLGDTEPRPQKRQLWKRRVTIVSGLCALLAAGVVLPPLVNISRYQRQITALMTRSMGRPVRMSGVELRLLPSPGFVLHDLSVSEDPAFGAEPILSARTVMASVRIFALWRGRLEISQVSVDEASLNLVRSAQGRWNLESLLMSAQPAMRGGATNTGSQQPAASAHFPYLEVSDSWVHFKNGVEKSPFSLTNTDLSLWQDNPGQWRVRLRGQPVRTDIPMSLADTGEVRMEASLQGAATLREMPLKLQMEWRDAQLGQLSRLLVGSDEGWRGDLTADIDIQGTPDAALTKARLRATGVRREEFVPETSLDFDANCSFRFQHSQNAAHDVNCDTALGDGRLHLKAEIPGRAGPPEATLEAKQVPVQAGLDLLRTLRSGFAPGIAAKGSVNGSLTYKEVAAAAIAPEAKHPRAAGRQAKAGATAGGLAPVPGDLQGTLTVTGTELSGGSLKEALKLPEITLTPTMVWDTPQGLGATKGSPALTATFTVPLGKARDASRDVSAAASQSVPEVIAPQSAAVKVYLHRQSYQIEIKGSSSVGKFRDLAYGLGWPQSAVADNFSGGALEFDLSSIGPWIAPDDLGVLTGKLGIDAGGTAPGSLSGTLTLHHSQWHADYLLHPVELSVATVRIVDSQFSLASDFVYGSENGAGGEKGAANEVLRGTVELAGSPHCPAESAAEPVPCSPQLRLRFGALDAAQVQASLLGSGEKKSLLSGLAERMRSAEPAKWPEIAVNVQADSLLLGPVTLLKPELQLRVKAGEVVVEDWAAGLLGGSAKGKGHFAWNDDKPEYALEGSFTHINGSSLGTLAESRWTGGTIDGDGKISLSGETSKLLSGSAAGEVHFDWQHGAIVLGDKPASAESRFDDWSGTAAIQAGKVQIGVNSMRDGRRTSAVAGSIPFGGAAKLTLAEPEVALPGQPEPKAAESSSPGKTK